MKNLIDNQVQQVSQAVTGATAIALGSSATIIQIATEWLSLTALVMNIVLGLGGLYLMRHKIWDRRRDRREAD